jgi:tRNA 2-thiouridine synthesizing protein A
VPQTRLLDVTGTFCPLPILLSVREMQSLAAGDVLELLGDDPAMLEDVPEWCDHAGHRLLQYVVEVDGRLRFLIEKGSRAPRRRKKPAAPEP